MYFLQGFLFRSRWEVTDGNPRRVRGVVLQKWLEDLVDLVGIEPTTSSMPWNDENRNLLTARALIVGRVGKNR